MKIKLLTKIEELPQFLTTEPVFCDIETHGLYINTRLVQFYQPTLDDTIYIYDLAPIGYNKETYKDKLNTLITYMTDLHLVFYNASYDLGTLDLLPAKVDDLFYAVKTAYCEFQEFSLDKVVTKLGYGHYYNGIDKKLLQKQGFVLGAYLSQQQIKYSAIDVLVLSKMWEDTRIQNVINNNVAYAVDILSLRYAVQYQQNGLLVDLPKRNSMLIQSSDMVEKLTRELPEGFNPNSYKQVRAYLDTEESDHAALVSYALSDRELAPKAKVIIDIKRAKKEVSYLESINTDKMYTRFNPAGAATGRFTSSGGDMPFGFNAQQIPRQFQKLFKADTETTTVIGLDYATLELRLACTIYGEPVMYKQLMNDEDLHTAMAAQITGKTLHKDGLQGDANAASGMSTNTSQYLTHKDRTDAKSANFGFVFGMSAKTYQQYAFVSYGISITLDEAVKLRTAYFTKYPKFKAYHEKVWNDYKKPSFYYETALGRRVKPKLGTDGINGPVQGSGAETTKLAVHYLVKEYPEALKLIFNVVHDAIYMRVAKEEEKLWEDRLAKAMVKGWEELLKSNICVYKDIPMPVAE